MIKREGKIEHLRCHVGRPLKRQVMNVCGSRRDNRRQKAVVEALWPERERERKAQTFKEHEDTYVFGG